MKTLSPQLFGLPSRTVIEERKKGEIILVIRRKSRIIQKDGRQIAEKIAKIKRVEPEANVFFATTAPVCSKTRAFLTDHQISVEILEE